jgi:hypothetical protein
MFRYPYNREDFLSLYLFPNLILPFLLRTSKKFVAPVPHLSQPLLGSVEEWPPAEFPLGYA